jgi:hypothetical protein
MRLFLRLAPSRIVGSMDFISPTISAGQEEASLMDFISSKVCSDPGWKFSKFSEDRRVWRDLWISKKITQALVLDISIKTSIPFFC